MSQHQYPPSSGRFARQIKKFSCALRFLTVIPLPHDHESEAEQFEGVVYYFGFVGLAIGALASVIYWAGSFLFPITVTAAITVIFLSAVSGFIHLDGLADTADGFLSNKDRDVCLEIMRDSRIGVMGAAAVGMMLLVKFSVLASPQGQIVPASLVLVPFAGRAAIVYSMALLPYARNNGGLGEIFYTRDNKKAAIAAFVLLCLCSVLLCPGDLLTVAAVPVLTALVFSRYCRKKIGGATGDTLGAACEITEAGVLVSMSFTFLH